MSEKEVYVAIRLPKNLYDYISQISKALEEPVQNIIHKLIVLGLLHIDEILVSEILIVKFVEGVEDEHLQ